MADEITPPSTALKAARKALAPFMALNPAASVEDVKLRDGSTTVAIRKPWGDASIAIDVGDDLDAIAAAINNVKLPELFTALWHEDTKDWEIIWTAHRLSKASTEAKGRGFAFKYRGKTYKCEYSTSSDRLIKLASRARFVGPSNTDYRNLTSFSQYAFKDESADGSQFAGIADPLSFWIRKFDWDDDKAIDLANHLNFYMTYYDASSPRILIHFPRNTKSYTPRTRYIDGDFPKVISGKFLDDNLVVLWNATFTGEDAARRFQLFYRIIGRLST